MLSLNPRNITQIKMARKNKRQYRVSIKCINNHVFEANTWVQEINVSNVILIAPWPMCTNVFGFRIENIKTVLNLSAAATTRLILIEPGITCVHGCIGVYLDIVFGSPVSKASFCQMLTTNREHLLHRMLIPMSSCRVTQEMYEENSFLRKRALQTFLTQILAPLDELDVVLENSVTHGITSPSAHI